MKLLNQIREIKYFFINLYGGICTIIDYIPILYKDRDWDQAFLLRLMIKKFDRMENYFLKHGVAADRKRVAKKIRIIKTLFKRIEEDDYYDHEYAKFNEKWGDVTFKPSERKGFSTMTRKNIKTEEDEKQYHKEFKRIIKVQQHLEKHDLDLAFKLLKQNLKTFWD